MNSPLAVSNPESATSPQGVRRRKGLRLKFLGVMTLVALIVVVAGGLVGYVLQKKSVLEEFQRITRSVAVTAALSIAGEDLERIQTNQDAQEPEFTAIRNKLLKVRAANEISEEIYILRPKNLDLGQTEFVVMTDEKPFVGNVYQIRQENLPAFRETLAQGAARSTGIYQDEHGTWISSFAPILTKEGRAVAVLEVDSEISAYLARVQRDIATQSLIAAAVFIFALIPGYFLVRRLTSGLTDLTEAMSRFRSGQPEAVTVIVKSNDEVQELAETFNTMTVRLQESTHALISSNAQLQESNTQLGRSVEAIKRSNAEIAAKTEELNRAYTITSTIMSTVQEGLFLLTPALAIEPNYSTALEKIIGRDQLDGVLFLDLIRPQVTAKTYELAERFLKLAFDARKANHVVARLNPLKEVEFAAVQRSGVIERRYLTFAFERVVRDQEVRQVLVTVQDVTDRVKLTQELRESAVKMERQAELLLSVLHVEPSSLSEFLTDAHERLEKISGILRREIEEEISPVERQQRYKQLLADMMREIHRVKGNAAVLRIGYYENTAHDFESRLTELASRTALDGKDFLPVVLDLAKALNSLQEMSEVLAKLASNYGRTDLNPQIIRGFGSEFSSYAASLADKLGKKILYSASLDPLQGASEPLRHGVKAMLTQLIRNSMTHGIETPEKRVGLGKPEAGKIEVFTEITPERIRVVFQDDGNGLNYPGIIARVQEMEETEPGILASVVDAEKNEWNLEALGQMIFQPGFSTAEEVTEEMGRGAGLDLVRDQVQRLGGTVSVFSEPGQNCQFVLDFPVNAGVGQEAEI